MVSFCTDGKLRLLSLRHQHFVQRLVGGIQRMVPSGRSMVRPPSDRE